MCKVQYSLFISSQIFSYAIKLLVSSVVDSATETDAATLIPLDAELLKYKWFSLGISFKVEYYWSDLMSILLLQHQINCLYSYCSKLFPVQTEFWLCHRYYTCISKNEEFI